MVLFSCVILVTFTNVNLKVQIRPGCLESKLDQGPQHHTGPTQVLQVENHQGNKIPQAICKGTKTWEALVN